MVMDARAVDFSMMLMLGLVSSLHCAGMCGPLVAIASAPLDKAREKPQRFKTLALRQVFYQIGRGISYFLAGAFIAYAGGGLVGAAPVRYAGAAVQISIGAILVAIALFQTLKKSWVAEKKSPFLADFIRRLVSSNRNAGIFGLGLASGILPCGVLFTAYLYASSAGEPLAGGLYMLIFWAGSMPALSATALFPLGLLKTSGKYFKYLLTFALILIGGWMLYKGFNSIAGDFPMQGEIKHGCH